MIKVGHAKIIQNEEKPNTKYGHCTSFSRWAYEHINEIHSLSFISNVYKQRFLVLVKNSKSVRNKLAKSAPLSRKLRNKTSQKKSGNPAQFIPRSWKTDRDSKQNQCCQFWRFCAKMAIFEHCLALPAFFLWKLGFFNLRNDWTKIVLKNKQRLDKIQKSWLDKKWLRSL